MWSLVRIFECYKHKIKYGIRPSLSGVYNEYKLLRYIIEVRRGCFIHKYICIYIVVTRAFKEQEHNNYLNLRAHAVIDKPKQEMTRVTLFDIDKANRRGSYMHACMKKIDWLLLASALLICADSSYLLSRIRFQALTTISLELLRLLVPSTKVAEF